MSIDRYAGKKRFPKLRPFIKIASVKEHSFNDSASEQVVGAAKNELNKILEDFSLNGSTKSSLWERINQAEGRKKSASGEKDIIDTICYRLEEMEKKNAILESEIKSLTRQSSEDSQKFLEQQKDFKAFSFEKIAVLNTKIEKLAESFSRDKLRELRVELNLELNDKLKELYIKQEEFKLFCIDKMDMLSTKVDKIDKAIDQNHLCQDHIYKFSKKIEDEITHMHERQKNFKSFCIEKIAGLSAKIDKLDKNYNCKELVKLRNQVGNELIKLIEEQKDFKAFCFEKIGIINVQVSRLAKSFDNIIKVCKENIGRSVDRSIFQQFSHKEIKKEQEQFLTRQEFEEFQERNKKTNPSVQANVKYTFSDNTYEARYYQDPIDKIWRIKGTSIYFD